MKTNALLSKIKIFLPFYLCLLISPGCDKTHACRVDIHIERYGLQGIPPNIKSYLSSVTDTTEFVTVLSKKKNLSREEFRLSDWRIDSFPSVIEEDLYYTRKITLKKAKCNY